MSDLIRVFRVVEYVGKRRDVEQSVKQSLHGTRNGFGQSSITAQTIGEFPESIMSDGREELIEMLVDTCFLRGLSEQEKLNSIRQILQQARPDLYQYRKDLDDAERIDQAMIIPTKPFIIPKESDGE